MKLKKHFDIIDMQVRAENARTEEKLRRFNQSRVLDYYYQKIEFDKDAERVRIYGLGFPSSSSSRINIIEDARTAVSRGETYVMITKAEGGSEKQFFLQVTDVKKDYAEFVNLIVKLAASKKTNPARVRLFRDQMANCSPEVVRGDFKACDRFDTTAGVASVRAPVLVVTSEDDILTPAKFGDVLEENIQNIRRVHLTGAGHLMSLEKSDEVNKAIREFLDNIDL